MRRQAKATKATIPQKRKAKDEGEGEQVIRGEMKVRATLPAMSAEISRPQEKRAKKYPEQVCGDILGARHEDKNENADVNELVVPVNISWKVPEVSSSELVCSDARSWIFT